MISYVKTLPDGGRTVRWLRGETMLRIETETAASVLYSANALAGFGHTEIAAARRSVQNWKDEWSTHVIGNGWTVSTATSEQASQYG